MNTTTPIYLVSFGDSNTYRLGPSDAGCHCGKTADGLPRCPEELKKWLEERFPADSAAKFFAKAKITVAKDTAEAEAYAPLDDKACVEIKAVLAREVEDMQQTRLLNSDAPFSDI